MTPNKDLVAASSVPLVLSILAKGDSYGYEIIQKVNELSEGQWNWSEGMLYPILHKLEKAGMIQSYWQGGDGQRKRRYYRIEPSGLEELELRMKEWIAVHKVLVKAVPGEDSGLR